MIRYLGKNITTDEADEKQTNPLKNIVKVNSKARTRTKKDKEKKRHFWKKKKLFMVVDNYFFMLLEVEYFRLNLLKEREEYTNS